MNSSSSLHKLSGRIPQISLISLGCLGMTLSVSWAAFVINRSISHSFSCGGTWGCHLQTLLVTESVVNFILSCMATVIGIVGLHGQRRKLTRALSFLFSALAALYLVVLLCYCLFIAGLFGVVYSVLCLPYALEVILSWFIVYRGDTVSEATKDVGSKVRTQSWHNSRMLCREKFAF